MGDLFPRPAELQHVEYVQLYFHLELCDYFDLPPLAVLQLRRELLQAHRAIRDSGLVGLATKLQNLLRPAPPADPRLRRQVQTPAPGLVLRPDISLHGLIEPKQRIVLPVLFIGTAILQIEAFCRLLEQLGSQGLFKGAGRFRLEAVESEDASGVRAMLWMREEGARRLTPPISDLLWWLERQSPESERLRLEVITPLRVLKQGKPLFRTTFSELFPFLMRRVSGLLAVHAGVEVVANPGYLCTLAEAVEEVDNRLLWNDWRDLQQQDGSQELGGLSGSLELHGGALIDLYWLLQLASLFGCGKGAAYGAGQLRLRTL